MDPVTAIAKVVVTGFIATYKAQKNALKLTDEQQCIQTATKFIVLKYLVNTNENIKYYIENWNKNRSSIYGIYSDIMSLNFEIAGTTKKPINLGKTKQQLIFERTKKEQQLIKLINMSSLLGDFMSGITLPTGNEILTAGLGFVGNVINHQNQNTGIAPPPPIDLNDWVTLPNVSTGLDPSTKQMVYIGIGALVLVLLFKK